MANRSVGKKVIAGGVEWVNVAGGTPSAMGVRESRPVTGSSPEGWFGSISATSTDDWRVRVYAICANVTP
jgi:hypothetical protein